MVFLLFLPPDGWREVEAVEAAADADDRERWSSTWFEKVAVGEFVSVGRKKGGRRSSRPQLDLGQSSTLPPPSLSPIHNNLETSKPQKMFSLTSPSLPFIPTEVKKEILKFCNQSTLARTPSLSLAFLELSSPLLYRHIVFESPEGSTKFLTLAVSIPLLRVKILRGYLSD